VGFNAMQPGRVKQTDLILFVVALAVIAAVIIWAMS
jgi:hypothetical protein